MTEPTLGEKLSPVLKEIEEALWKYEANNPGVMPRYPLAGLKASVKILGSVIMSIFPKRIA